MKILQILLFFCWQLFLLLDDYVISSSKKLTLMILSISAVLTESRKKPVTAWGKKWNRKRAAVRASSLLHWNRKCDNAEFIQIPFSISFQYSDAVFIGALFLFFILSFFVALNLCLLWSLINLAFALNLFKKKIFFCVFVL